MKTVKNLVLELLDELIPEDLLVDDDDDDDERYLRDRQASFDIAHRWVLTVHSMIKSKRRSGQS